jgi:hypothetical protein
MGDNLADDRGTRNSKAQKFFTMRFSCFRSARGLQ